MRCGGGLGKRTGGNGNATADALSRTIRCIGTGENQAGPLGDERHQCGADSGDGNTASDSLKTDLAGRIVARYRRDWREKRDTRNQGLRFAPVTRGMSTARVKGWRNFSTSGKGRDRSVAQDVPGINGSVTRGRSTRRCACPMDASSCSRSASLSIGRAQKTIQSRLQSVRRCESMPASGLRHRGDARHKSHAFREHRQEAPSRPPARFFLLVCTTNKQSSSLIP